jgi:tetrahydromethanopterin S-methyltransferase subunit B
MSNSQNETDELKTLQREAAELRAERKGRRSKAKTGAEEESQASKTKGRRSKATSDAAQESQASQTAEEQRVTESSTQELIVEERVPEEEQVPELEQTIQDLVTHLERAAKELQDATVERPALGLLAAFTTGIVVGYLLKRR